MTTNRAVALNQRYGVGFWEEADAAAFAAHETDRLDVAHDVKPHPIHGTGVVVYDVAPAVSSERKVA